MGYERLSRRALIAVTAAGFMAGETAARPPAHSVVPNSREHVIVVDDYSGNPPGDPDGCDGVSIAGSDGRIIMRGPQNVSPGKIDETDEGDLIIAGALNNTNSMYGLEREIDQWQAYFITPGSLRHLLYGSAVRFVGQETILTGTRQNDGKNWAQNPKGLPYYLSLYDLTNRRRGETAEVRSSFEIEIQGVPIAILDAEKENEYFIVRTERFDNGRPGREFSQGGHIWVDRARIDSYRATVEIIDTVECLPIDTTFEYSEAPSERFAQASVLPREKVAVSGGARPVVQIIDMHTHTSHEVPIDAPGIDNVFGIAYNWAEHNEGLTAIHTGNAIVIGRFSEGAEDFQIVSVMPVGAIDLTYIGLTGAIAWDEQGTHIIAAIDGRTMEGIDRAADFILFPVVNGIIEEKGIGIIACTDENNSPGPLFTQNKMRRPNASPQKTPFAEPTPTDVAQLVSIYIPKAMGY